MQNVDEITQKNKLSLTKLILSNNLFIGAIILICVFVVASILIPAILQPINILNVLRTNSISGIVAVGLTMVLIIGEIDLSVGSIMSMSLVVGGMFLSLGSIPALIITCLIGLLLGFINGYIITKWKMSSLMVTLGMLSVYAGLANVISNGQATYLYESELYLNIGKGYIAYLPVSIIIFLIVVIILTFILLKTKFGKEVYYSGANSRSAWLCGIKVNKIKIIVYMLCGLCAAMAGPLLASQTNRIIPTQGAGYELTAIAIAVLGGTTLDGGKGSVVGTLLGALTFGFLLNALSLSKIGTYAELVLKGALIIGIVILLNYVNKRAAAICN
jgi:ribose/xylose/arabinose/galactoside ABC-type transport system permease subunit